MRKALLDKFGARASGICLYGFAPPKRTSSPEELKVIAAQQVERLSQLAPDGVIVYDIQDETGRTSEARPFRFSRPLHHRNTRTSTYDRFRCPRSSTAASTATPRRASCAGWPPSEARRRLRAGRRPEPRGARRFESARRVRAGAATRSESTLGGIAIAERHQRHQDEHERILAKTAAGCRFFVTQAVYDLSSTLSLLSDYWLALHAAQRPAAPLILTFSPCGSLKTLAFMKWLGIHFPRWLENELRFAADPLQTSLRLCESIFPEAWTFAKSKSLPLGVNVESVSIRKVEIDASVELASTLRRIMEAI